MRILSVVGARPQFIKAAPLSAEVRQYHDEYLVHTGQHYDDAMSKVFFQQLGIPEPDINLGVGGGSHAEQTARIMIALEKVIEQQQPEWMLVYGDTNSTLAAALAAAKVHLPIMHVEAGLRSYNRAMPEEINRVLTDHLSRRLFCPTPIAVANLAREGITAGVVQTGDIMVDAVLKYVVIARQEASIHTTMNLSPDTPYAAVTIHRPANTDTPETLSEILAALNRLPLPVVFPVHPRTRKMLQALAVPCADHVRLVAPLAYLDMLALLDKAAVLVTDSGGLQKEAYVLRTPCVTVRTETEWVETVESGWNRLVTPEQNAILEAVTIATESQPEAHPDYYGDGRAAVRIVQAINE